MRYRVHGAAHLLQIIRRSYLPQVSDRICSGLSRQDKLADVDWTIDRTQISTARAFFWGGGGTGELITTRKALRFFCQDAECAIPRFPLKPRPVASVSLRILFGAIPPTG
jgi:hypothetical protein